MVEQSVQNVYCLLFQFIIVLTLSIHLAADTKGTKTQKGNKSIS